VLPALPEKLISSPYRREPGPAPSP